MRIAATASILTSLVTTVRRASDGTAPSARRASLSSLHSSRSRFANAKLRMSPIAISGYPAMSATGVQVDVDRVAIVPTIEEGDSFVIQTGGELAIDAPPSGAPGHRVLVDADGNVTLADRGLISGDNLGPIVDVLADRAPAVALVNANL